LGRPVASESAEWGVSRAATFDSLALDSRELGFERVGFERHGRSTSWALQHSVDASASEEERISISFNIMFSSFTKNLSKPLW